MLSRMKAAYIFYFQYSFQEIRIINMYVIIHGSVIIYMCSKAVWKVLIYMLKRIIWTVTLLYATTHSLVIHVKLNLKMYIA